MYFLPFYFLRAIHCQREEKYSCFPLDFLWLPLSLSRRAEEIAEETRTSSDTAYTASKQRCFKLNVHMQQYLAEKVWHVNFSSKSYKLGYFGLQIPLLGKPQFDGEVWHKAGTAPFQYFLPCRCGADRARGEKGWWNRAAQGSAAKQGPYSMELFLSCMLWQLLPRRTHGNSGTPARVLELEGGHSTVLQTGQACADPQGRRWETEGWVCPKISFKMCLSAEKAHSAAQALCGRS